MAHWSCDVVLVKESIGDHGDSDSWDDFSDDSDGSKARITIWHNVEPQIHFLESSVHGNWYSEDFGLIEQERNQGDEAISFEEIEFSFGRYERFQQFWLDSIVGK